MAEADRVPGVVDERALPGRGAEDRIDCVVHVLDGRAGLEERLPGEESGEDQAVKVGLLACGLPSHDERIRDVAAVALDERERIEDDEVSLLEDALRGWSAS